MNGGRVLGLKSEAARASLEVSSVTKTATMKPAMSAA